MTIPISTTVLQHQDDVREAFRSRDPLPEFVVIPNFLRKTILDDVSKGCESGKYSTYCSYVHPLDCHDVKSGFCEPNEKDLYVTIHHRPTHPIIAIQRLEDCFKSEDAIGALSALTGRRLSGFYHSVLICWGRGAFIAPHNDYDPNCPAQLVLSLTLTKLWRPSYGGMTIFAWVDADRAVRFRPRLNTAVLFAPHSGSVHWVEQISDRAPPRRRFTWTAFFT
jgi:2OG-Fe(II) oxygenase superfamily